MIHVTMYFIDNSCRREPLPSSCTEHPIDLVFMLDGSSSISEEDFSQVKDWILGIVDRLTPGYRTMNLTVFVVQFSEDVRTELHQTISQLSPQIRAAIRNIEQMRFGTKTYQGLKYVNSNITPKTRPGAFRVLITMTDGSANEGRDEQAIDTAKENYDHMVAVAVGNDLNADQLQDFVQNSVPITVDEYASLAGIIDTIVNESCNNIEKGRPYHPAR